MRVLVMLGLIALVPIRSDPTPKEEIKSPQQLILGDWRYTGDANNRHPPNGPMYVFRITPTHTEWIENGKVSAGNGFTAKATFDFTKNPVTVDMMPRHNGSPILGILKLEGDRFTLAWTGTNVHPADFSNRNQIHHFERVR